MSFLSVQAGIFDDLKDELKDTAKKSLEEKKQELGLSDGDARPEAEDVSLVFSGATESSPEVFTKLHANTTSPSIPIFAPIILSTGVFATLKEDECFAHVQGKIAWNSTGTAKRWAASNVKRLCKGTTSATAPGNCFKYAMRSGGSWGKTSAHKMDWPQAVDLCEGIISYETTTKCFRDEIRSGKNLGSAIKKCERGSQNNAATSPSKEAQCIANVQGKIAWDPAAKIKSWAATNVNRLCKDTSSATAPGNCFKYAMRSGSSWGKTSAHKMNWAKALDLCEGISNSNKTNNCFKQAIQSGKSLDAAIKHCERK